MSQVYLLSVLSLIKKSIGLVILEVGRPVKTIPDVTIKMMIPMLPMTFSKFVMQVAMMEPVFMSA